MSSHKEVTHLSYLDSVRGLAAFSVLCSHYIKAYELPCRSEACERVLKTPWLHFFWDGGSAVCLFFILSGFVLSRKYFATSSQPSLTWYALSRYFLMRGLRILPPYWIVLTVSALIYPYYDASESIRMSTVPHQDLWIANLWSYPMQWSDFFREANLLGLPERFVYLPQAWTLSIELTLSLWIPFAVMLALWCLWAFIITGCAWMLCFGGSSFIFHFMLGIAFAKYHDRICHSMERDILLCSMAGITGFVLYAIGESLLSRGSDSFSGWIPGIGAFMMLACCASSPRIQRLLNIRLIRYLGKISYSVYLIHFSILFTITPRFLHWLDATPEDLPYAWWAGFMLTTVVTVLLADINYRWVETPARRVLRK